MSDYKRAEALSLMAAMHCAGYIALAMVCILIDNKDKPLSLTQRLPLARGGSALVGSHLPHSVRRPLGTSRQNLRHLCLLRCCGAS